MKYTEIENTKKTQKQLKVITNTLKLGNPSMQTENEIT